MGSSDIAMFKQQIIDAANTLVSSGVMSLSQHGNISARVTGTDTFLLTAGGSLVNMKPENIALFQMDGTLLEGAIEPTGAEIVGMHGIVYRLRPDMGGAVHTHSPAATSYAVASQPIPLIYEAQARFNMTDGVPVAGYGPRGSQESVDNIANAIESHPNIGGVLLENHGVLTFGVTAPDAARANLIIEESAILGLNASMIGEAKPIPPHMVEYTQQRRDQFSNAGVQRAD
ncbi:MAG: class II aldolase/adducin family protein [Chloroflexi bacterium]|nr:class II aldolase/adducin family protein [Chloroflexota bacterium]